MTKTLEGSPRALLSRSTLVENGVDKRISAQIDEAIASIEAMASSRVDLEGQNDRLQQDVMSLRAEVESAAQRNETLTRKLAETHEIIASLSAQSKMSQAQLSEAIAKAKAAERAMELQGEDLGRLLDAVRASSPGRARMTAHMRLVGQA